MNPTDTDLKEHYQSIVAKLPTNLVELTKLYESSRSFDAERFWNWDDWEMIPDGGVQSIDFHSKLDRLFCIKALTILQPMNEEQIAALSLPISRDLAFMAEDHADNRTLIGILKDISANPTQWLFALTQPAIDKVPALQGLLTKVKKDQELSEEEFLKTVVISENKIKEFKKKILEAFDKGSDLRKIFNKVGAYDDKTNEEVGTAVPSIGYNQIDQKAAFIENWYVHYGGWGDQYGRGMADSEDQVVFQQMVNDIGNKKNITKEDIVKEIQEYIHTSDIKNPLIIHTMEHMANYELKQSELFIDRYRHDCPENILTGLENYSGVFKMEEKIIPIVELFVGRRPLANKILIIDLKDFASWNQYSPIDKVEDADFKEDIFYIKVIDLNEDNTRREKIMTENPAWLNEHPDKEGYLRQHVIINIYEKFKVEIEKPTAGIALIVGD